MFYIHILSLAFVALVMASSDHKAFLWFKGRKETLERKEILRAHKMMWIGLGILVVSGGVLFYPVRNYLIHNVWFLAKMFFVVLLTINGLIISKLSKIATEKPYSALSKKELTKLYASAFFSLTGWIGATITAFFLFD